MPQPCSQPTRRAGRRRGSATRARRAADQRCACRAAASSVRLLGSRARAAGSCPSRSSARRATSVGGSSCIRSSRSSGCRCGPGKTSLRAEHHRGVRHAPAVGVEHRRHRQHARRCRAGPSSRGSCADQRVQHGRAVRIDHALGPARWCPRCSTSTPGRSRRAARSRSRPGRRRRAAPRSRRSPPAPARRRTGTRSPSRTRAACRELLVQRQQDVVDDQEAVLRVARRSSRSRRATGAGSACASRRPRPGCRNSTRGARGGSSTAWRRARPSSGPAAAAPRRARACAGSTRRSVWRRSDLSGRRETISDCREEPAGALEQVVERQRPSIIVERMVLPSSGR